MRIFIIEGQRVDIDEKTAIGVTYQTYNVANPAERSVNSTNSISIPATPPNLALFGYPSNPSALQPDVYSAKKASYYIDSQAIVANATVRFDKIVKNRIYVTLFEKTDIWNTLKSVLWSDMLPDYLIWLNANYSIPIESDPMVYTIIGGGGLFEPDQEFKIFIDAVQASGAVKLAKCFTPLVSYTGTTYAWDGITVDDNISAQHINGGHFVTYIKPLFEYIEATYGVSFFTADNTVDGNIFFDSFATSIYTPIRDMAFKLIDTGSDIGQYLSIESDPYYYGIGEATPLDGKTIFEFIDAYFKLMNVVITPKLTNAGVEGYQLLRFDEVDVSNSLDWTGKIERIEDIEHSFFIPNTAQENVIKFSKVYENGSEFYNSKKIACNNTALPYTRDMVTINAFAAAVMTAENPNVSGAFFTYLNLSKAESFTDFVFLSDSTLLTDHAIEVFDDTYFGGNHIQCIADVNKAALVSIAGEYQLLTSMYAYPVVMAVNLWLSAIDMYNFNPARPVWFKEFGASFFINKISGFNPELSTRATKVELIKISTTVPNGVI